MSDRCVYAGVAEHFVYVRPNARGRVLAASSQDGPPFEIAPRRGPARLAPVVVRAHRHVSSVGSRDAIRSLALPPPFPLDLWDWIREQPRPLQLVNFKVIIIRVAVQLEDFASVREEPILVISGSHDVWRLVECVS